jgi:hypothetical protein
MVLPKLVSQVLAADTGPDPSKFSELEPMVQKIISLVIGGAGVVLFFLLISGGFQLITSGGDPGKVAGAWKTITYAIGGLVVILLSILILRLIHTVTGVDVTQFKINIAP